MASPMLSRLNLRAAMRSVGGWNNDWRAIAPRHGIWHRCASSIEADQDRIYTSEQRDIIIDKLNSMRTNDQIRQVLGIKVSIHVETHLLQNGNFTKLEELLRVPTIGPKTVRNLCDKLLGVEKKIRPTNSGVAQTKRKPRSYGSAVSPSLSEETSSAVKLLIVLVVDVTSVSWAVVDTKKKYLLDWKTVRFEETIETLRDIIVKGSQVEKMLPDGDLYVLEDPSPRMSAKTRGSHHLKSHLTCSLSSAIHNNRETTGRVKLAFVKSRLVENHFKASIGSETVSLQPYMHDIIDQRVEVGRSNIFIPQELVQYMKTLDAIEKEQLSRAGLLAISCIDLILTKSNSVLSDEAEQSVTRTKTSLPPL